MKKLILTQDYNVTNSDEQSEEINLTEEELHDLEDEYEILSHIFIPI